jgi:hypothetical protein
MLMKRNRKWLLVLSLLFVTLSVLPGTIHAQGPNDPSDITDPDAPIDGGVGLLVAAGIGYGIKKVRDNQKKKMTHLL